MYVMYIYIKDRRRLEPFCTNNLIALYIAYPVEHFSCYLRVLFN